MMKEELASHQIKLLPLAIILLLLQPPPAAPATTSPPTTASTVTNAGGGVPAAGEAATKDGSNATSEPQGGNTQQLATTEQPNPSDTPFLQGITLTAIVVVSILGGSTCLIICVVVSVAIAVNIKRWKVRRSRRETSTTHTHTLAVNMPDFDMTNNSAYHSGQQGRAITGNGMNVYTARPSSRASNTQNNQPKASVLPDRYAPNNRVDLSVDSLGYVKLPKPHN